MNKLLLLTWLLRLNAFILLLALVPVFFPYSWMNTIHGWLSLGELPKGTITEYLTRSLSLVYALHGAVCLALALNVKKYLDLIQIVAVFHITLGIMMLMIDLKSGMPWYWTVGEGPMIAIFAVFVYFLTAACRNDLQGEANDTKD